ETGKINEEFDRWFLDRIATGQTSEIASRYARHEDLEAVAGNGGQEIRDWLAVAGAMPPELRAQVLAYEPLGAWFTGTGIMAWSLDNCCLPVFLVRAAVLSKRSGRSLYRRKYKSTRIVLPDNPR